MRVPPTTATGQLHRNTCTPPQWNHDTANEYRNQLFFLRRDFCRPLRPGPCNIFHQVARMTRKHMGGRPERVDWGRAIIRGIHSACGISGIIIATPTVAFPSATTGVYYSSCASSYPARSAPLMCSLHPGNGHPNHFLGARHFSSMGTFVAGREGIQWVPRARNAPRQAKTGVLNYSTQRSHLHREISIGNRFVQAGLDRSPILNGLTLIPGRTQLQHTALFICIIGKYLVCTESF